MPRKKKPIIETPVTPEPESESPPAETSELEPEATPPEEARISDIKPITLTCKVEDVHPFDVRHTKFVKVRVSTLIGWDQLEIFYPCWTELAPLFGGLPGVLSAELDESLRRFNLMFIKNATGEVIMETRAALGPATIDRVPSIDVAAPIKLPFTIKLTPQSEKEALALALMPKEDMRITISTDGIDNVDPETQQITLPADTGQIEIPTEPDQSLLNNISDILQQKGFVADDINFEDHTLIINLSNTRLKQAPLLREEINRLATLGILNAWKVRIEEGDDGLRAILAMPGKEAAV